ncbi:MAG TPA: helix-turn-helix transcriptional regulator [Gaiellaceae bacterium]|nr:helix-turn-helix transcriptional regulator [Gaiellaceae bacterium]
MAVVGRLQELAEIERLLDRGRGVLLLEGEAGIGKTTLWREGVRLAESRSLRVIAAQPVGSEEGIAPDRLTVCPLGPLSLGALGRLLQDRLGASFPRWTLRKLHEAAGGNPFYALELARALKEGGTVLSLGDPLPVRGGLRDLLRRRFAALPSAGQEALLVASALSAATVEMVGRALERDPLLLLEPALEAQLVEVEGERLRFSHPLLKAAVYDLAFAERRRRVHRRLAELVADPEERARHLALSAEAPDADVAALVEQGALTAFARGSPAAAAELAHQARRLTPPERREDAARRALAEVEFQFEAGGTAQAAALLDELIADAPPGPRRARLLSRRARIRHFGEDIGSSVELLRRSLAEAGDDAGLRAEVEEGLAWGLLLARRDLAAALDHARSAAGLAAGRQDRAALAEALAVQALLELALGLDWQGTMQRALALEEATLHLRVLRHPSFAHGYCLSCADEVEAARGVFEQLRRRAEEKGDESALPSLLNHLALVELLAGDWARCDRYAEDGYALAVETGQRPAQASVLAKRAMLAARRGQADEAQETALEALALAAGSRFDPARPEPALARGGETAIWTLGFLELSLGRPEGAHRYLAPLARALLACGLEEPGEVRCLPDLAEALTALGRLDEAEGLVQRLEAWARRLRRASAQAAAGRCRGLLLLARGDAATALGPLASAAAAARRAELPFERARTLLAFGLALRRARRKRDARAALQEAEEGFARLGAAVWAEKARAELRQIGGRTPSRAQLTPAERRVVELVCAGRSNKEVAQALYVTPKTVEFHLRNAYAKLGVRSRVELVRTLLGRA